VPETLIGSPHFAENSISMMKLRIQPAVIAGLATLTMGAVVLTPTPTMAESTQRTNLRQIVSGLINVNVGAVAVNVWDITLEDLVDVNDVLNNNNV
jgi:hypothetical protein